MMKPLQQLVVKYIFKNFIYALR